VVAELPEKGKRRAEQVLASPLRAPIFNIHYLRPAIPPVIAPQMTLMAGVAVADAITLYCPRPETTHPQMAQ